MFSSTTGPSAGDNWDEAIPRLSESIRPLPITGAAVLTKLAFDGEDLSALLTSYQERLTGGEADAGVVLDISTIFQLAFNRDTAMEMQRQAISHYQLFRITGKRPPSGNGQGLLKPALHVLALVAPGDLMVNTPLEFILKDAHVVLDFLYIQEGRPLPEEVPDHDVAFIAVSEPDENAPLLERLDRIARAWPRPVINDPARILQLSRERVFELLHGLPGVRVPATLRIGREDLERVAETGVATDPLGERLGFPLVVRPIGSHAGEKLWKLDDAAVLLEYLASVQSAEYYLMPFIDYRNGDGLFRKYRVVFILGEPYLCHMAVSERWMIHYLNAGMTESLEKRREEETAMATFESDFAVRHAKTLRAIHESIALEYFGIDCGETAQGELLVFEVDVAMVIHDMDPPELFPYKRPQMKKVFAAFERMLEKVSHKNRREGLQ